MRMMPSGPEIANKVDNSVGREVRELAVLEEDNLLSLLVKDAFERFRTLQAQRVPF